MAVIEPQLAPVQAVQESTEPKTAQDYKDGAQRLSGVLRGHAGQVFSGEAGPHNDIENVHDHERELTTKDHNYGVKSLGDGDSDMSLSNGRRGRGNVSGATGGAGAESSKKKAERQAYEQMLHQTLMGQIQIDLKRLEEIDQRLEEIKEEKAAIENEIAAEEGADWLDKSAEKYGIDKKPGESEENFKERVMKARARDGDPRGRAWMGLDEEEDDLLAERDDVQNRLKENYARLRQQETLYETQLVILQTARVELDRIQTLPESQRVEAYRELAQQRPELGLRENVETLENIQEEQERVETKDVDLQQQLEDNQAMQNEIEVHAAEATDGPKEIEEIAVDRSAQLFGDDDLFGDEPAQEGLAVDFNIQSSNKVADANDATLEEDVAGPQVASVPQTSGFNYG